MQGHAKSGHGRFMINIQQSTRLFVFRFLIEKDRMEIFRRNHLYRNSPGGNRAEGIAVAVPILYATGSRKKALLYSLLSGLAEPAGALIGFFFLLPFLTPVLLAVLFAVVAGVMIYISFDELLPMAETYGKHHIALAGVLGGMLFIGAGLEFL